MADAPTYAWTGQIAWITGASSGIGEALARTLSACGAQLILSGRRAGALQDLADSLPTPSLVLAFDTTDHARLPEMVAEAWAWRGRIDLLVNNAGVSQRSLALDTRIDVYRTLMEVDYLAPVHLTQLVLPRMVARGSGHLAAVSSVAGKIGTPLRAAYAGAKHALVGYFDALRAEVEQAYGVKVSTILPGSVRTQVSVNALQGDGAPRGVSDTNIENGMDPADAARIIVEALARGEREIVVAEGQELAGVTLRRTDPERLFAVLAAEGARLAALRAQQGAGFVPEPSLLRPPAPASA